ncbi:hypothetical protein HAX54_032061, partial [Datura stramonium]|nr:hypothetical protein [Datura stramonium]
VEFLLQRDRGRSLSPVVMNLGNNCGNHRNDTLAAVASPLQQKCNGQWKSESLNPAVPHVLTCKKQQIMK